MPRPLTLAVLLAGLALGGAARSADQTVLSPYAAIVKPKPPPDDAKPLGSDGCNHTFERAGYPEITSHCAQPSNTPNDCGYYVGGGCVCGPYCCHGGPPSPLQGTFGWDYCCGPCGLKHRVVLGWCFGCRPKGGLGSYQEEGPRVPNPLAWKLPSREGECYGCVKH